MDDKRADFPCPMVVSDIGGYRSPVDGSWIEGRRARRYDLEKNNAIDANELRGDRNVGEFKNERFKTKYGLK